MKTTITRLCFGCALFLLAIAPGCETNTTPTASPASEKSSTQNTQLHSEPTKKETQSSEATLDAQASPQPTPMRLTDDAFRFAAYEGKLDLLREGLAAGNYVNAPDPEKKLTPLHMAAYNGHTEVIKLLLEHGATLDARDIEGKTALLHACTGPFPAAVKMLLDAGADINTAEATEAFTPLMMAAGLGQTEVVRVLLERKANKALRDNDGDTALIHAQNGQHAEIVRLLQD